MPAVSRYFIQHNHLSVAALLLPFTLNKIFPLFSIFVWHDASHWRWRRANMKFDKVFYKLKPVCLCVYCIPRWAGDVGDSLIKEVSWTLIKREKCKLTRAIQSCNLSAAGGLFFYHLQGLIHSIINIFKSKTCLSSAALNQSSLKLSDHLKRLIVIWTDVFCFFWFPAVCSSLIRSNPKVFVLILDFLSFCYVM